MILNDLKNIKRSDTELRKFGYLFAFLSIVAAIYFEFSLNKYLVHFLIAGVAFLVISVTLPKLLKPLYLIWMGIAVIIGFFVARIILSLLYYLVITPIGFVLKIGGNDLLDRKLDKNADSYWTKKVQFKYNKLNTEKQY